MPTPNEITLEAGQEVTIVFKDVGTVAHNFTIGDLGVKSDTVQPGQTTPGQVHARADRHLCLLA